MVQSGYLPEGKAPPKEKAIPVYQPRGEGIVSSWFNGTNLT